MDRKITQRNDLFSNVRKILIVKPSALGDIVHSLPVLYSLKEKFPQAKIDWVVAHGLHTFLEDHPLINRLWVIKKDEWKRIQRLKKTLKEIYQLKRDLRKQSYDVCIDLSGLLRSGIISGITKAPVRLGLEESDEGSHLFYTHKVHGDMNIHAVDRYLKLAAFMGAETNRVLFPFAPYSLRFEIAEKLPEKFVVMSPSAGKEANRWSAKCFGELAARLPLPVVVIASKAEAYVAEKVVAASKGKAISLAGQTNLKDLVALIEKADFFISNDTGPMHIAAALNIPVFAIFGPANPKRTGPYGDIHTIIQKTYPCIPCYARKRCTKYDFRCLKTLEVEEVVELIQKKI